MNLLHQQFNTMMSLLIVLLFLPGKILADANDKVNITADLPYVNVIHNAKKVRVERNQQPGNMVIPDFAKTSRPCPPYCIQPIKLAAGVETIGELELLDYLKQTGNGGKVMVIDSREPQWLAKGMIPGAAHIPWTLLHNKTNTDEAIAEILQFEFNAVRLGQLWNFDDVKTLVFYCNGPWCGQSPTNIRALLSLGYPANKIKWYRGGMQSWQSFGFTTVKP